MAATLKDIVRRFLKKNP